MCGLDTEIYMRQTVDICMYLKYVKIANTSGDLYIYWKISTKWGKKQNFKNFRQNLNVRFFTSVTKYSRMGQVKFVEDNL